MPIGFNAPALYSRIKLALLREAYNRHLLSEAQLAQLVRRQLLAP